MALYDLAILGGRLIDGSGKPWFHADLGIKNGRIAVIGRIDPVSADATIDAGGMVVCPGFIDLHTHSDIPLLMDGDAQSKVRQGVTFEAAQLFAGGGLPEAHGAVRGSGRHGAAVGEEGDAGHHVCVARRGVETLSGTSVVEQDVGSPPRGGHRQDGAIG